MAQKRPELRVPLPVVAVTAYELDGKLFKSYDEANVESLTQFLVTEAMDNTSFDQDRDEVVKEAINTLTGKHAKTTFDLIRARGALPNRDADGL